MNLAACRTFLCRCGLRYTYARDVSMGCMTATAAAADKIPETAPSIGDPGANHPFAESASDAIDATVRLTELPSMSLVTDAPTPL